MPYSILPIKILYCTILLIQATLKKILIQETVACMGPITENISKEQVNLQMMRT